MGQQMSKASNLQSYHTSSHQICTRLILENCLSSSTSVIIVVVIVSRSSSSSSSRGLSPRKAVEYLHTCSGPTAFVHQQLPIYTAPEIVWNQHCCLLTLHSALQQRAVALLLMGDSNDRDMPITIYHHTTSEPPASSHLGLHHHIQGQHMSINCCVYGMMSYAGNRSRLGNGRLQQMMEIAEYRIGNKVGVRYISSWEAAAHGATDAGPLVQGSDAQRCWNICMHAGQGSAIIWASPRAGKTPLWASGQVAERKHSRGLGGGH